MNNHWTTSPYNFSVHTPEKFRVCHLNNLSFKLSLILRPSLGPRPKTNPSADHFPARYIGSNIHAEWGLGTRLSQALPKRYGILSRISCHMDHYSKKLAIVTNVQMFVTARWYWVRLLLPTMLTYKQQLKLFNHCLLTTWMSATRFWNRSGPSFLWKLIICT